MKFDAGILKEKDQKINFQVSIYVFFHIYGVETSCFCGIMEQNGILFASNFIFDAILPKQLQLIHHGYFGFHHTMNISVEGNRRTTVAKQF